MIQWGGGGGGEWIVPNSGEQVQRSDRARANCWQSDTNVDLGRQDCHHLSRIDSERSELHHEVALLERAWPGHARQVGERNILLIFNVCSSVWLTEICLCTLLKRVWSRIIHHASDNTRTSRFSYFKFPCARSVSQSPFSATIHPFSANKDRQTNMRHGDVHMGCPSNEHKMLLCMIVSFLMIELALTFEIVGFFFIETHSNEPYVLKKFASRATSTTRPKHSFCVSQSLRKASPLAWGHRNTPWHLQWTGPDWICTHFSNAAALNAHAISIFMRISPCGYVRFNKWFSSWQVSTLLASF